MKEEIAFENGRISDFHGLVLHTVMRHSSTSIYIPNFIEIQETFCGRTDVRAGGTFETHFIRSTRSSRPKNGRLSPVHTSDNVAKNGDIVAKTRDIVAETGDIVPKNGDIVAETGNIVAKNNVAGFCDNVAVFGDNVAGFGNNVAVFGDIVAGVDGALASLASNPLVRVPISELWANAG